MHVTLPNWWSAAIEQCGRHVGTLFGLMNGLGVVGALASQWFVGAFSRLAGGAGFTGRAQWDPMFDVYVVVLVLGGWAWLAYRFRPLPGAASRRRVGTPTVGARWRYHPTKAPAGERVAVDHPLDGFGRRAAAVPSPPASR